MPYEDSEWSGIPIPDHMTDIQKPVVMTAAEVAKVLKVSTRQVERLTAEGLLPHRRLGTGTGARHARYTLDDITEFLETARAVGRGASAPVVVPPPLSDAAKWRDGWHAGGAVPTVTPKEYSRARWITQKKSRR